MQVVNGCCFYQMLLQEQDLCTKSCTYFSLWAGAQTIYRFAGILTHVFVAFSMC